MEPRTLSVIVARTYHLAKTAQRTHDIPYPFALVASDDNKLRGLRDVVVFIVTDRLPGIALSDEARYQHNLEEVHRMKELGRTKSIHHIEA
jgi:hypothetical protein